MFSEMSLGLRPMTKYGKVVMNCVSSRLSVILMLCYYYIIGYSIYGIRVDVTGKNLLKHNDTHCTVLIFFEIRCL